MDVNEELRFCENAKKVGGGGPGPVGGWSGGGGLLVARLGVRG